MGLDHVGFDKGPSLAGARIEDASFAGARLHAPDFEGARITDGWLVDADISADITGLRLNGVEVGPLVEAELDRLFPERVQLRASDPAGLVDAWAIIEAMWESTFARAHSLSEEQLNESVDDEWSFIQTQRHLILATDCWLRRMVKGMTQPYHPWGLAGSWLTDPASWGLDVAATPSLEEVVEVRRERMDEVEQTIAAVAPEELVRVCVPPPGPGHPTSERTVLNCMHVILNEEWEHHRYAVRDLDVLQSR